MRSTSPASSSPQPLPQLWLMPDLLQTQLWPSINSPLPATQDRLRILAFGPRICLQHLLHLCPAIQCQNPRKQGHSPRLGPSPATKELSAPTPSPVPVPSSQPSTVSNSTGSSLTLPHLALPPHHSCGVHFPCFSLLLQSGMVGGFSLF